MVARKSFRRARKFSRVEMRHMTTHAARGSSPNSGVCRNRRRWHLKCRFIGAMLVRFCATLLLIATSVLAQSETGRVTFEGRVQGSSNRLGTITRLDGTAGYNFTRRWSITFGVPYYVVNASDTTTTTAGTFGGIGNVYGQIRFARPAPNLSYLSTLTGTAPTGDRAKGLSTGHGTVDWSNYIEHSARLTPFAEAGLANAVSDTQFFLRPFETSGFVTHFQAGARYRIVRRANLGVSGYAIEGYGNQTVVSRVVTSHGPVLPPVVAGIGKGLQNRVFETQSVVTGSADLARDRGFSSFLVLNPRPSFDVFGGFTRSTEYDLNTVFFGVGVRVRKSLGLGTL